MIGDYVTWNLKTALPLAIQKAILHHHGIIVGLSLANDQIYIN
jgi:hypothetical protein